MLCFQTGESVMLVLGLGKLGKADVMQSKKKMDRASQVTKMTIKGTFI